MDERHRSSASLAESRLASFDNDVDVDDVREGTKRKEIVRKVINFNNKLMRHFHSVLLQTHNVFT